MGYWASEDKKETWKQRETDSGDRFLRDDNDVWESCSRRRHASLKVLLCCSLWVVQWFENCVNTFLSTDKQETDLCPSLCSFSQPVLVGSILSIISSIVGEDSGA